jgi:hypothetical protein
VEKREGLSSVCVVWTATFSRAVKGGRRWKLILLLCANFEAEAETLEEATSGCSYYRALLGSVWPWSVCCWFFVSIKVACTSTFVIREESTTTECWLRFSSLQEEQRSGTREFRLFLLGFFFLTTSWSRLGDSQIFLCILSFPIVGGLPRSCMCACVSLSHPRRSFEASELEGNTQRAQRHLWRPRKNPIRRLNQVRLVLPLPFPSFKSHS